MDDYQKIFDWIEGVIFSCTDDFHFEAVDKLIELYDEKFNRPHMTNQLKFSREIHWNAIHHILK